MSEELDRILQEKDPARRRQMILEFRSSEKRYKLTIADWSSKYCNQLVASCIKHLRVVNVIDCIPLGQYPYYFRDLKILDLYDNHIQDLEPLSHLPNLKKLDLGCNSVRDLSPLSNLTQLTHLYLQDNAITNLRPLSNLTNLRTLNLSNNPAIDLSPLDKLVQNGLCISYF